MPLSCATPRTHCAYVVQRTAYSLESGFSGARACRCGSKPWPLLRAQNWTCCACAVQMAAHSLEAAHKGLVHAAVARFHGVPWEDLESAGIAGLHTGLRRFDAGRSGAKLCTVLAWWIRQAVHSCYEGMRWSVHRPRGEAGELAVGPEQPFSRYCVGKLRGCAGACTAPGVSGEVCVGSDQPFRRHQLGKLSG